MAIHEKILNLSMFSDQTNQAALVLYRIPLLLRACTSYKQGNTAHVFNCIIFIV